MRSKNKFAVTKTKKANNEDNYILLGGDNRPPGSRNIKTDCVKKRNTKTDYHEEQTYQTETKRDSP